MNVRELAYYVKRGVPADHARAIYPLSKALAPPVDGAHPSYNGQWARRVWNAATSPTRVWNAATSPTRVWMIVDTSGHNWDDYRGWYPA